MMPSPSYGTTRLQRGTLFVAVMFLVMVAVPRWFWPDSSRSDDARAPALHGTIDHDTVVYSATPVKDVLEDVSILSGVRAVASSDVADTRFSGTLPINPAAGPEMASRLAADLHVSLRKAGPHYLLTKTVE